MELKKNPKYDLTKQRGMFFNLGLSISVMIAILAFEWPNRSDQQMIDLGSMEDDFENILQIPPTTQPPPPPPKVQTPEIIEVPDEEEIEEKIDIELDVEVTEDTQIEEIVFADAPEEVSDEIFMVVEKLPEFPGGEAAFMKFLYERIKYPMVAKKMGIEGRLYLQFVVEKNGSVTDLSVLKGLGAGCDEEALRVMKLVPNFTPGKQRGTPVRVKMTIPIVFKLS